MAIGDQSAARRRIPVLPTTRAGAIGAALAAVSFVVIVLLIASNSRDSGVNPLAFTWAVILISGVIELYAIARRGERSILGFIALIPAALLIVLLGMEATGLME
jgi:lipid-A-disaccharide synthase-like uncharacterized protein